MKRIDLHVHSNVSDGTFTPKELILYAQEKGLAALALTDHDTVRGIFEAEKTAEGKSIELIPGIEISSEYKGGDIHILGLYIDYKQTAFSAALQRFVEAREQRNNQMAKKLSEHGFFVTIEDIMAAYPDAVITRAHFAKYMKAKGYVSSYEEAFRKYIGKNCSCYVPRTVIQPEDAIGLIRKAGGVAVLAHPLLYHLTLEELEAMIKDLKKLGLQGIEVFYSMNQKEDENLMFSLAKKWELLMTGGSDFHGSTKPHIDLGVGRGNLCVNETLLEPLRKLRKREENET